MSEDDPGLGFVPPIWAKTDTAFWEIGWRWSGHAGEGQQHPRVRTASVRRKAAEDTEAELAAMRAEAESDG